MCLCLQTRTYVGKESRQFKSHASPCAANVNYAVWCSIVGWSEAGTHGQQLVPKCTICDVLRNDFSNDQRIVVKLVMQIGRLHGNVIVLVCIQQGRVLGKATSYDIDAVGYETNRKWNFHLVCSRQRTRQAETKVLKEMTAESEAGKSRRLVSR